MLRYPLTIATLAQRTRSQWLARRDARIAQRIHRLLQLAVNQLIAFATLVTLVLMAVHAQRVRLENTM